MHQTIAYARNLRWALLACTLAACFNPVDVEPGMQAPATSALSFRPSTDNARHWQLWWQDAEDQELAYTHVRYAVQDAATLELVPFSPDQPRWRRSWKGCSHHRPRHAEGWEPSETNQEREVHHVVGAAQLAALDPAKLEPGRYLVEVVRVNAPNLQAFFEIDGSVATDIVRLERRMDELSDGVCQHRSARVQSLSHALFANLDAATLRQLHEGEIAWLKVDDDYTLTAEQMLEEVVTRNALTSYFGGLVTASVEVPEALWELSHPRHLPYFVRWIEPHLQAEQDPSAFAWRVLEQGQWSAPVMDFIANRLHYLRDLREHPVLDRGEKKASDYLYDLADLVATSGGAFSDYYPDEHDWLAREFPLGRIGCCGYGFTSGCGFGLGVPDACDDAIAETEEEFGLGDRKPPALHEGFQPEFALGI